MLIWVEEDDHGDGDDDDDDDNDAPEPGPDRLTGSNRSQYNTRDRGKRNIIATKKSKTPKKYTSAMFDEYKRGIELCWGVAADKDLVPDGMETTDNNQRRLRRELQSYGTPKDSVLELLHELAQTTQNRQEAAWVRITEEFRKRKGRNKVLSNKDIRLTIQYFKNKSQERHGASGSPSVPQDEPSVGESQPENIHGDVEEAGARLPSHRREQHPQSHNGHDNTARSRERAPSLPHRGRQQSARTQPYVRQPPRSRRSIPDSTEELDLRDALNSHRAAKLQLLLARGERDHAYYNYAAARDIAQIELEVVLAAQEVQVAQGDLDAVRRRIWEIHHAGDDDMEMGENGEEEQLGDELEDHFGDVDEDERGGVLLNDGVQREGEMAG
jgi:hypothetical protein